MSDSIQEILSQTHQAGRIMGDKIIGEEIQADIDDGVRRLKQLMLEILDSVTTEDLWIDPFILRMEIEKL